MPWPHRGTIVTSSGSAAHRERARRPPEGQFREKDGAPRIDEVQAVSIGPSSREAASLTETATDGEGHAFHSHDARLPPRRAAPAFRPMRHRRAEARRPTRAGSTCESIAAYTPSASPAARLERRVAERVAMKVTSHKTRDIVRSLPHREFDRPEDGRSEVGGHNHGHERLASRRSGLTGEPQPCRFPDTDD